MIPSFEFKMAPEKPTALNNCGDDEFESTSEDELLVVELIAEPVSSVPESPHPLKIAAVPRRMISDRR